MPITKTVAAQRAHYSLVINDPDFYDDLSAASNKDDVLKRYGLSRDETMINMDEHKLFKDGLVPFTGGWMKQDERSGKFTVLLKSDIKKHQLQELWEYIQRTRKMNSLDKQSKLKSPDDPELLYAIFKARVRGHTFPQIFDMYRAGTLPSYENKPTNNYLTEFELKKYYSRYYNPI
ncbi:MAG TPA: hypothetical protein VK712_02320 [Verrucomicrobiae bacterium]|jgi:hypothetical protein|nr:hypothetical protein [Verrucomicrobiae bacterium]